MNKKINSEYATDKKIWLQGYTLNKVVGEPTAKLKPNIDGKYYYKRIL